MHVETPIDGDKTSKVIGEGGIEVKVFNKFLLSFLVIAIMTTLLGFFTMYFISRLDEIHEEVIKDERLGTFLAKREIDHLVWSNVVSDIFLNGNVPDHLTNYDECNFGKWYYSFTPEDYDREVYLALEAPHQRLHTIGLQIVDLYEAGMVEDAGALYHAEMEAAMSEVRQLIGKFEQVQDQHIKELEATVIVEEARAHKIILILAGAALLTAVVMALVLNMLIVRPVVRISEKAILMAEGDLTIKIGTSVRESKDEITGLAHSFDVMVQRIRGLLQQISATSENLTESSGQLREAAQASSAASEQVAAAMEEVAARQESQSTYVIKAETNVQEIFGHLQETERIGQDSIQLAESTSTKADEGERTIAQMMAQMQQIKETIEEGARISRESATSSSRVGEILSFIDNIATQTQLLALNAAIEAARAGEAGRGFSVVADEIKSLAEETASSLTEVKEIMLKIQSGAGKTEVILEKGQKEVEEGIVVGNRTRQLFSDILGATRETVAGSQQTAASIAQTNGLAGELTQMISEINAISAETSESAQQVSGATEEQTATVEEISAMVDDLSEMAQRLDQMIQQFKLS